MAVVDVIEDVMEDTLGVDTAATRADLPQATHAGGDFYTSPEVYAREKHNIFMQDWLWVARQEEIPNAGDFMTCRIADEPLVLTRNGAGEIKAFANVCAHRGVEVASGVGNTKEFSCPYHGWLYDLDGKLVGAPYMKEAEGFDPASCRLKPLHVAVWQGWVVVSFSDKPVAVEDWFADFDRDFSFLHQERCRLVEKATYVVDCNWKLAVENFMDYYHAQVLHADTFGGAISIDSVPFTLHQNGGFSAFYDAAPTAPGDRSYLPKMPWLADQEETFGAGGAMAPNVNIFGRIDEVFAMINWPISIDQTRIVVYMLIPEEHLEIPELAEIVKRYRSYLDAVVEEDVSMVRALQRNMYSTAFEPGRMSKIEEPIHHFVNHNFERIFARN